MGKGQVWTGEFILAFIIFVFMVLFSVGILLYINPSEDYDELYLNTVHLSGQLMTPGTPKDWNPDKIILPGIVDGTSILNTTKLEYLEAIGYEQSKVLLHTTNEYLFYFENASGIININNCVHGYSLSVDADCNPEIESLEYDDLVRIDRYLVHNSSIIRMVVYSWN